MRDAGLLHIYNLYGSDVFLALELDKSNFVVAFFTFRTSSWHYDGERTDLHDCLSILFSIACAVQQKSISLWDIQNEWTEIEEELYGRYATVTQPNLSILRQDDSGLVKLDELFTLYRLYLSFLGLYFSHSSKSPKYAWDLPHIHSFREKVALSIGAKTDDVVVVERCRPDWTYVQIYKHGIAALKSPLVRPLLGSLHQK